MSEPDRIAPVPVVYVNGRITDAAEAVIPVFDRSGRRSLVRGTRALISLSASGTGTGHVALTVTPGKKPVPAHRTSAAMALMTFPRKSGKPAAGALNGWSTTVIGPASGDFGRLPSAYFRRLSL